MGWTRVNWYYLEFLGGNMVTTIKGYMKVWDSAGAFSRWKKDIGFSRRTAAGVLKAIDLAVVPFKPGGRYLERLRIEQIYGLTPEIEAQNLSESNIIHNNQC